MQDQEDLATARVRRGLSVPLTLVHFLRLASSQPLEHEGGLLDDDDGPPQVYRAVLYELVGVYLHSVKSKTRKDTALWTCRSLAPVWSLWPNRTGYADTSSPRGPVMPFIPGGP